MWPIFNKSLCEKRGLWSREQCTGPTNKHILVQNLLVKEVVGPVYLTTSHVKTLFSIKKKKKKENAKAETLTRNAIQVLLKCTKSLHHGESG